MSIFQRVLDNLKAMSQPAKSILDEAMDSVNNWAKTTFEENGNASRAYSKQDQDLLNGPTKFSYDQTLDLLKDTLMVAFISLAAKIAKSDGQVIAEEIKAFDEVLKNDMKMSVADRKLAADIFNVAKKKVNDYQSFASQIASSANGEIRYIIYSVLFKIVSVNRIVAKQSEAMLIDIGNILKISQQEYDEIWKKYLSGEIDPYQVLGASKSDSLQDIKKKYKKLVLENHPDRLMSKGLPDDFMREALDRMRRINEAWSMIEKSHG